MKPIVGWEVKHPYSFKTTPTRADQLVPEMPGQIWADFDWPDLFDSQAKAWETALRYLTEMRGQALADIEQIGSWWKPVPVADGVFEICTFPPGFVEDQMQEARQQLRIAEAGLALVPSSC